MAWWQYLLLVNLYLILFYGFYTLLLRSETFFHLNRAYLVISALLSFFIPLIHAEWISKLFITQRVHQTISVYAQPINIYRTTPIESPDITIGAVCFFIYTAGIIFLIIKLIGQLISLKRLIQQPESTSAFSFFKSIRLGNNLENKDIIEQHEKVHATQWHSADVMLIEAIAIINWFNPIVYFYKHGIRYIHEYIADRQALKNGTSKTAYALLLLSQTLKTSAHQLATPFHTESLLKKRIIMLQKDRSQYVALVKYGFSAPLFMAMLILASAAVIKNHTLHLFGSGSSDISAVQIAPPYSNVPAPKAVLAVSSKADSSNTLNNNEAHPGYHLQAGDAKNVDPNPIFVSVEENPTFKEGMVNFYRFLAANLQYPRAMIRHNVQGRVVIEMTVEKDGSLTNIRSLQDIGYGSAEEAIRVIRLSPRWRPGYQNGRPVRVRYTLPLIFNLVTVRNQGDTLINVTYPIQSDGQYQQATEAKIQAAADSISLDKLNFQSNPLIVLDGKAITDIKTINQRSLNSARVIRSVTKDNVYYILYGEKALNGVIVLESKSAALKEAAEQ